MEGGEEAFRQRKRIYKIWKPHSTQVRTRYLRFTKTGDKANIAEIVIYEIPGASYPKVAKSAKKEVPWDIASEPTDAAKAEKAVSERKLVDAGAPFGKLPLIDEVNCGEATDSKKHEMMV